MLKKTVTYHDIDGNPVEEEILFNLSPAEMMEMQIEFPGGYDVHLQKVVEAGDPAGIYNAFKDMLLRAYGVRSPDGKRLVKSPQAANEFATSEPFSIIVMELAQDETGEKASEFFKGIFSSSTNAVLTKANAQAAAQAQAARVDTQQP